MMTTSYEYLVDSQDQKMSEPTEVLCKCGCGQAVTPGKQWISSHNNKLRAKTVEQLLSEYTDKNGPVHPILGTPCWIWTGSCNKKVIRNTELKPTLVHTSPNSE